jgi:hypothetical protein
MAAWAKRSVAVTSRRRPGRFARLFATRVPARRMRDAVRAAARAVAAQTARAAMLPTR